MEIKGQYGGFKTGIMDGNEILKAQIYFEEARWSEQEVVTWLGFSIKKMYLKLRDKLKQRSLEWLLSASVYAVWQERNLRIFQKNARSADINIRNIIQEVHIRGNRQTKLTSTLSNLDYYP
ncbi:hypothetical protein H5410_051635 [Solanum commersonii]|uniref:Uncharacterized protein n=1 Tax=Solanum commersonii TaxID=4109 RepID=A0A9J5X1L1_SOLCO|nr:hypothetical protein H5410_051635 [Solanum commersonii]